MATSGSFTVSENGAATYSLPIQVPPGTAGMEPKLSLVYTNQGGNGLLGMGWSLSGLSAITRCPRTIAQDGIRGGVHYDANDKFCLDGQRLILVAGTSYATTGAEYRTERDIFSKVTKMAVDGKAYFIVKTKSGQEIEYGNSDDSRIEVVGGTKARVFAINKITDTKGNYLTIKYTENTANGDYRPVRIDYTGNDAASLGPYASVQFGYDNRDDVITVYSAGAKQVTATLLTSIRTCLVGPSETCGTGNLVKEYRLVYPAISSSGRSRLSTITECDGSGICKPPVAMTWSTFGSKSYPDPVSGTFMNTGFLDVNGDGRADAYNWFNDRIRVSLAQEDSKLADEVVWIPEFDGRNYRDRTDTPVMLQDMTGDGLADVVVFGRDGVRVFPKNGTPGVWVAGFGTDSGWNNLNDRPRTLADVNGDGLADIVGFAARGVLVALNTGHSFAAPTLWIDDFGASTTRTYPDDYEHPRMVVDVNADGLADIVGFWRGGVYVALNTGANSFAPATKWFDGFGLYTGEMAWHNTVEHPRTLADVNGDHLPDIVGFSEHVTRIALNTGDGFVLYGNYDGFSNDHGYELANEPRYVMDVNGDGRADIVGFSEAGVKVALANGAGFDAKSTWTTAFATPPPDTPYGVTNPDGGTTIVVPPDTGTWLFRHLADVDGDGYPDPVGCFEKNGSPTVTKISRSARVNAPDFVTSIENGLGIATKITYQPLTDSSIYAADHSAEYPVIDLAGPMYVVGSVQTPNGLGSGVTTNTYRYGGLKAEAGTGRGSLGFRWVEVTETDTGLVTKTTFRQDWPYQGLPAQVVKSLPGPGIVVSGQLSVVANKFACLDPALAFAPNGSEPVNNCTVAPGNRYFPYVYESTQQGWDLDGSPLPVVTTTSQYDNYGNVTTMTVGTNDGYSKTTVNTYQPADTERWYLGRLLRSEVTSVGPAP
jgi:hypothetical protein